jgi:hypothetical protein
MTLNPQPSYPNARSYVLKLHRDAQAEGNELRGRLEHIATGRQVEFRNGHELLDCLARELATA